MGQKIIYCGETTFWQRAKIALNPTQALILESYLEGTTLAMKNGVPLVAIEEEYDDFCTIVKSIEQMAGIEIKI